MKNLGLNKIVILQILAVLLLFLFGCTGTNDIETKETNFESNYLNSTSGNSSANSTVHSTNTSSNSSTNLSQGNSSNATPNMNTNQSIVLNSTINLTTNSTINSSIQMQNTSYTNMSVNISYNISTNATVNNSVNTTYNTSINVSMNVSTNITTNSPFVRVGEICSGNASCYSGDCQISTCSRGSIPEGYACRYEGIDDECDYGLVCTGGHCVRKNEVGESCSYADQCTSGVCNNSICEKGDSLALCAVINDYAYNVSDADMKDVAAKMSDLLYRRTKQRLYLLFPIERKNVQFNYSQSASDWIDECYLNHTIDPPNVAVVYVGDPNVLGTRGGHTIASNDLRSLGFCNSFASPLVGPNFIYGGNIDYTSSHLYTARSGVHEILHYFGVDPNVNLEHSEGSLCYLNMGDAGYRTMIMEGKGESRVDTYGGIPGPPGWFGMCPYAHQALTHVQKNAQCKINPNAVGQAPTKANGQSCSTNTECISGLCGGPLGGAAQVCLAANLDVNQFCLTDVQCRSNACVGYRCFSQPPVGTNLPQHAFCTLDSQCQSGFCFGSHCEERLQPGQPNYLHAQCAFGRSTAYWAGGAILIGGQCTW